MSKRVQIIHSDDATTVLIRGNVRNPEPATVVVKFPGGNIEVSRCSDGTYWAHFQRCLDTNEEIEQVAGEIVDSRVDFTPEAWQRDPRTPALPAHADIQHIAVRIARAAPQSSAAKAPAADLFSEAS